MSKGANVSIVRKGNDYRVQVKDDNGNLLAHSTAMTHGEALQLRDSLERPGNPLELVPLEGEL